MEQWWEQDEASGREAAYGELVDEELCCDLAGKFAPGRQAEAVLVDLKTVREKVRAEKTAAADPAIRQATQAETAQAAALDRARRFDAVGAKASPVGDLRESLGAATASDPAAAARPSGKDAEPQESMTARLLKAKKRAQAEQRDEET